jgi:integrase
MKRTLNDRLLKSLKPAPAGKTYDVMDTIVPGFGVRVSEKGRKTFMLVARYGGSKNPTRRAMGTYGALTLEAGRKKARHWLELIDAGKDPSVEAEKQRLAEIKRAENSFEQVCEAFISEKLPGERQGKVVERDLRRVFIPAWGKRPVTDITPLDVIAIIRKFKQAGKAAAAYNLLGYARRLFAWCIDAQIYGLTTSPCDRLRSQKIIGKRNIGQRVLNSTELRALWLASEKTGYPYGPYFQMLALSGQRRSEVGAMQWREIDFEKKLWVIPASRMKSGTAHTVPLTAEMLAILESLPRFDGGDFVFSTTLGAKPLTSYAKNKQRLDALMLAELRAIGGSKAQLEPFTIHDIRRSMRTGLAALSISSDIAELVIAHVRGGLLKIYDRHSYESEKRHALEQWGARLRDIVRPAPQNVLKLVKARV